MRRYFRYLSDLLYVRIEFPYIIGNVPYRVDIKPTYKDDSFYTTVYRGSIYSTGKAMKVYLNDIIETNMDSYEWFNNRTIPTGEDSSFINRTYVDVKVVFDIAGAEMEYLLTDIINGYLSPDMEHELKFDYDSDTSVKAFMELGYKVIPHIPYGTRSWQDEGMVVDFSMPVKLFINSDMSDVRMQIRNASGNPVLDTNRGSQQGPIMGINIGSALLDMATINGEGYTIYAKYDNDETPLAIIDYKPAEYYLMWINRHGAVQCQPFCKKNTLNESVSTDYISTLTNDQTVSNKKVEYNWSLNSHWLTYNEHGEFESLLVSKYVWLYDVAKGWFYPVNVTNSNWSYKNPNNNKRPFNLNINLKLSQSQNINY